ncbi:MAG: CRTAC1 family protein [Deltaproteobacteria bacterium]|nr:CRTAC1 family protein [Deltaproteobacteria bacterium]
MRATIRWAAIISVAIFAFAGCDWGGSGGTDAGVDAASEDGGGDDGGSGSDRGADDQEWPPTICLDPGQGPYSLLFSDVTAELGLGSEGLGMTGSNVTIADVDGDHWPDIVVTTGQASREFPAESSDAACEDELDNDADGLTDCEDPSCGRTAHCIELAETGDAQCGDGSDNDGDGATDCDDPDCQADPEVTVCGDQESSELECGDGSDNDDDGLTDCADPSCARNRWTTVCDEVGESDDEQCADGQDNDADGLTDCADWSCQLNPLVSACARPVDRYRLLRNAGGAGFEDWTWRSGLFRALDGFKGRATNFVIFGDVDGDGDADAFSAVSEDLDNRLSLLDHSSIYYNKGNGEFFPGPQQRFSSGDVDPVVSAAFLDYDHDGWLDLWVGHHYGRYGYLNTAVQDSLFAGDGTGRFTDVTDAVGLTTLPFSQETAAAGTNHKPSWGLTACDVDGDGWTDLMACSYGRQFNAFYRNLGGESFEDLTLSSGFGSDDRLDYGDNQFFLCYCSIRRDDPYCEDAWIPSMNCSGMTDYWSPGSDDQPYRLGGNSSNAVCGDIDNDGDMDLLAVELAHWHIGESSDITELLVNDGFPDRPLQRPGREATGLEREHIRSWNEGDLGGLLADFDNDGRLDVLVASSDYPGTYSLLYQQQSDGRFDELGEGAGARIHRAHGLGLIDFDRDGDYDLVIGTSLMRWASNDDPPRPDDDYAYLLRNDSGQDANKLMIALRGRGAAVGGANSSAVGARITVTAGGETFMREVQGGYGLTGCQQDPLILIGIGAHCVADELRVRWPNAEGSESVFTGVKANYVLQITEGQDLLYIPLEDYRGL